jgi:hypothetical protein
MKRLDLLSLASGVVVTALGVVVLIDSSGAVDLPLGWVAVAVTAALGIVMLLSGTVESDPDSHD